MSYNVIRCLEINSVPSLWDRTVHENYIITCSTMITKKNMCCLHGLPWWKNRIAATPKENSTRVRNMKPEWWRSWAQHQHQMVCGATKLKCTLWNQSAQLVVGCKRNAAMHQRCEWMIGNTMTMWLLSKSMLACVSWKSSTYIGGLRQRHHWNDCWKRRVQV